MAEPTYVSEAWLTFVPPPEDPYWVAVERVAKELKTDGCSWVKDYYLPTCWEHDIHWRTGKTLDGDCITVEQLNRRFRYAIQARSRFRWFSPMSWWRWMGVTINARINPPVQCEDE